MTICSLSSLLFVSWFSLSYFSLSTVSSNSLALSALCDNWDRIWKVTGGCS